MICDQINTCHFIRCFSKLMPITAINVKAKYCNNIVYGCAKYQDHEVIAIDKERGNLCPGSVMGKLELFEKKYSDSYIRLCVRQLREIKENNKFEFQ